MMNCRRTEIHISKNMYTIASTCGILHSLNSLQQLSKPSLQRHTPISSTDYNFHAFLKISLHAVQSISMHHLFFWDTKFVVALTLVIVECFWKFPEMIFTRHVWDGGTRQRQEEDGNLDLLLRKRL